MDTLAVIILVEFRAEDNSCSVSKTSATLCGCDGWDSKFISEEASSVRTSSY